MTKTCRVCEYVVQIRTEPHKGWEQPYGWGPYYTEQDAKDDCHRADKLWMAARVSSAVVERQLSDEQIRELRALGCVVAS
jgi:hypothetical protein